MLFMNHRAYAVASLTDLFDAIERNIGDDLIAIGRPEPGVPQQQKAHVKIAYMGSTGANPDGLLSDGQPCCIVHTAMIDDRTGKFQLSGGTYDLTPHRAWELVR